MNALLLHRTRFTVKRNATAKAQTYNWWCGSRGFLNREQIAYLAMAVLVKLVGRLWRPWPDKNYTMGTRSKSPFRVISVAEVGHAKSHFDNSSDIWQTYGVHATYLLKSRQMLMEWHSLYMCGANYNRKVRISHMHIHYMTSSLI